MGPIKKLDEQLTEQVKLVHVDGTINTRLDAPKSVEDVEDYWDDRPPALSNRCVWWMARIINGWRSDGVNSTYSESGKASVYGVYVWEYINVIRPLLRSLGTKVPDAGDI